MTTQSFVNVSDLMAGASSYIFDKFYAKVSDNVAMQDALTTFLLSVGGKFMDRNLYFSMVPMGPIPSEYVATMIASAGYDVISGESNITNILLNAAMQAGFNFSGDFLTVRVVGADRIIV